MSVRIRSRIHQFFSQTLLKEIYNICRNSTVSDNNLKVAAMIETLNRHNMDFVELGPGTNRLAILIDNYVFKLALDKWGMRDNLNEFTVSQELQPYVVKTYETNELISVCEYVTVISREEFEDNKDAIRQILSILAEGYLLGDVGTVMKNFANWGYRDDGELVILDFAYIYRVQGDELLCSQDQSILEYDENFHNLKCPHCHRKYTFIDVRRRITMEQEKHENMLAKQLAYKVTKPLETFDSKDQDGDGTTRRFTASSYNSDNSKEETNMQYNDDEKYMSEEEQEDSYLESLELLKKSMKQPTTAKEASEEAPTNIIEIQRESPKEKSQIRIVRQSFEEREALGGDTDGDLDAPVSAEEAVQDAVKFMDEIQKDLMEAQVTAVDTVKENEVVTVTQEVIPAGVNQDLIIGVDLANDDQSDYSTIDPAPVFEEDAEEGNIEFTMTSIMEADVDNDGENEIVIDTQSFIVPESELEEVDHDDMSEMSEEDVEMYNIMTTEECDEEPEVVQPVQEEVIFEQTVKVADHVNVTNTVKVQVDTDAEALRRQLMADVDDEEVDEERVEELAEQYAHLQDEADDYVNQRKGGNKTWK
jgi:hypothetical protein